MFRALVHIAGVVLLRFPLPLRAWALLVAALNFAAVFFLDVVEGRVVFLALLVALLVMAIVYQCAGFVRLLGLGHVTWLAMLPWLFVRLPHAAGRPSLYAWLSVLLIVDAICLIVDAVDVVRYALGERAPHYRLEPGRRNHDEQSANF